MSETKNEPEQQVKAMVDAAIGTVKTPEQADQVIADLEQAAGSTTEAQVAAGTPPAQNLHDTAAAVESAAATTPRDEQAQATILEAAAGVAAAEGGEEERLSQALQQTSDDVAAPQSEEERRLLQEALLRRLHPLAAADTAIFLLVNQMPHPPALNRVMELLTSSMNRGDAWIVGMVLAALLDGQRGKRAMKEVLPVLWLTTLTVEYPIKAVFRRRRPFIALVRSIVVGKKPGGYSFPSGHSAASFAGAWLISRHYPGWAPACYGWATLVAFSRVYLGVHYPGDVLIGAASGTALAAGYRALLERLGD